MLISAHILKQAIHLYLTAAYPNGTPPPISSRIAPVEALPNDAPVPLNLLEASTPGDAGVPAGSYALRLGQPLYPHMKLVLDPVPRTAASAVGTCRGCQFLLRADAHDRHLHAAPGSPDDAWLTQVRASNRALVEKIESDWAAAGLPTFKEYLRAQLEARKKG